jgi:hypothetical protein
MNKDKKRVLKDYPNAYVGIKYDGSYIVLDGDIALAEEFFLPPALTEDEAWSHAALSCKTAQHFNRTHPLRLDLKGFEAKMARIEKRKRRSSYVR